MRSLMNSLLTKYYLDNGILKNKMGVALAGIGESRGAYRL
jgi:hypothetical protein